MDDIVHDTSAEQQRRRKRGWRSICIRDDLWEIIKRLDYRAAT